MRRWRTTLTALALAIVVGSPSALANFQESPTLAARVAAGDVPPVSERLPEVPFVDTMDKPWQSPGKYGGTLRVLMGGSRDLRQMTVYGYARLVGYRSLPSA